jgi:hypothetical protein
MTVYRHATREQVELIAQLAHERYIADPVNRARLQELVRSHLAGAYRFTPGEADATVAWLLRRPARRGVPQRTMLAPAA